MNSRHDRALVTAKSNAQQVQLSKKFLNYQAGKHWMVAVEEERAAGVASSTIAKYLDQFVCMKSFFTKSSSPFSI